MVAAVASVLRAMPADADRAAAEQLAAAVRATVPVRSGRLRKSVQADAGRVRVMAPYARRQDRRHRFVAAAVKQSTGDVAAAYAAAITDAARKGS